MQFADDGWPITWCEGSWDREKGFYDSDPNTKTCGRLSGGNAETSVPFQAHLDYSTTTSQSICPGGFAALGETLAYVPYFQMVATFLVCGIAIKAGIAKPQAPSAKFGRLFSSSEQLIIEQLQADMALVLEKTGAGDPSKYVLGGGNAAEAPTQAI